MGFKGHVSFAFAFHTSSGEAEDGDLLGGCKINLILLCLWLILPCFLSFVQRSFARRSNNGEGHGSQRCLIGRRNADDLCYRVSFIDWRIWGHGINSERR